MSQWFVQKGYPAHEAVAGATEAAAHLSATLDSEEGRWVLAQHEQAACEASYTTANEGELQTHVIDRTFIHGGVRWIVDYKTATQHINGSENGEGVYLKQLLRYRELFPQDAEVCLGILYTSTGRLAVLK